MSEVCGICGAEAKSRPGLNLHMLRKHDMSLKDYEEKEKSKPPFKVKEQEKKDDEVLQPPSPTEKLIAQRNVVIFRSQYRELDMIMESGTFQYHPITGQRTGSKPGRHLRFTSDKFGCYYKTDKEDEIEFLRNNPQNINSPHRNVPHRDPNFDIFEVEMEG